MSIIGRGYSNILKKCTVKASNRAKAYLLRDAGNLFISILKQIAGFSGAKHIDVVVKAEAKLFGEKMRYVATAEV